MKDIDNELLTFCQGGWCKCICKIHALSVGSWVSRAWPIGKVPNREYCKQSCRMGFDSRTQDMFDCIDEKQLFSQ